MYYAGKWLMDGTAGTTDVTAGFQYLKQAADAGVQEAYANVGLAYYLGIGTDENKEASFPYLKAASEQGVVDSMTNLGNCYMNAYGTDKDAAEALKWFIQAAESEIPEAMYNAGMCCCHEESVKDYKEALKWFEKADEAGLPEAAYQLGNMYAEGLGMKKPDYDTAVEYYLKVSSELSTIVYDEKLELRTDTSAKLNEIGNLFAEEDAGKAFECYLNAAQMGNSDAMYNTGMCYLEEKGVEKSESEALKWFVEGKKEYNTAAADKAGDLYFERGKTDSENYSEAFYCYAVGAEEYSNSMYHLGVLWENGYGNGNQKSYSKAAEYYAEVPNLKDVDPDQAQDAQERLVLVQEKDNEIRPEFVTIFIDDYRDYIASTDSELRSVLKNWSSLDLIYRDTFRNNVHQKYLDMYQDKLDFGFMTTHEDKIYQELYDYFTQIDNALQNTIVSDSYEFGTGVLNDILNIADKAAYIFK